MADQKQVIVSLIDLHDELLTSSPEFQDALRHVTRELDDAGVVYSQRGKNFDAGGVQGYALGQLTIALVQFASPALGTVLAAWVASRSGRKLKLKVGDVEEEANSQADIDLLINRALVLKVQSATPDDAP